MLWYVHLKSTENGYTINSSDRANYAFPLVITISFLPHSQSIDFEDILEL